MKPTPLIEESPEVIREKLAEYFGIDPSGIRVEKHKLGDGRKIAYLRLVWTVSGCMPELWKKRWKKTSAPQV